jgi:hypothetical protein
MRDTASVLDVRTVGDVERLLEAPLSGWSIRWERDPECHPADALPDGRWVAVQDVRGRRLPRRVVAEVVATGLEVHTYEGAAPEAVVAQVVLLASLVPHGPRGLRKKNEKCR